MATKYVNAVISEEQGEAACRCWKARSGPAPWTSRRCTPVTACSPTTLVSVPRPRARAPLPSWMATTACCCIAAIRSRSWPSTATSSRWRYLLMHGELPDAGQLQAVRGFDRQLQPAARAGAVASTAASAAMPTRWRSWSAWSGRCRRSITMSWTSAIRRTAMLAAMRLVAKMPTIAAASYTYSIGRPQRYPNNRLDYASNFLQMMFGSAEPGVSVDPVLARALDRDFHPACRSRAERLDLDGAAGGLQRRQSVRLHRRRHRLAVGTGARRCQRGGAQDADGNRHGRKYSEGIDARQGQERFVPA